MTEAMGRRAVVLLIDVEPDARKTTGNSDGWKSSEVALDHLERLRGSLEAATGAPVQLNWFLRCDPQIRKSWGRADWVAQACPRIIRTIERTGDFAGVHVHLWKWSESRAGWYNDLSDSAWTAECLDTAIEAFAGILGHRPEASRFGDRWLSDDAVRLMRTRGIRLDVTVEPGLPGGAIHDDPHSIGTPPDFRSAPRHPWPASAANFLYPDPHPPSDAVWMLPLTTTRPALRLVRRAPWLMVASRPPNLSLASAYVWPHLRRELDRPTHLPLVMVFRSGDLANATFMRNFSRTTALLSRHPALSFCDFTNPADAISRWRRAATVEGPGGR